MSGKNKSKKTDQPDKNTTTKIKNQLKELRQLFNK